MREKTSIIIIAGLTIIALILGGMLIFKNDTNTPTTTIVTTYGVIKGFGYELTYATSGVDLNQYCIDKTRITGQNIICEASVTTTTTANKVIVGCTCEHLSLPIATPMGNLGFVTISIGD